MKLEQEVERHVAAMNFACLAHAGQNYGEAPYVRHLAHVESVLQRFSFPDFDLLSAAWLHDCIEDAGISWRTLDERFGEQIAMLVFAVTDGEGANRRERKAASYAKMVDLPRSIILKLADRIANVESSMANDNGLMQMYRKEYQPFREKLLDASFANANCGTRVASMWSYLSGLMEQPSTESDSASERLVSENVE